MRRIVVIFAISDYGVDWIRLPGVRADAYRLWKTLSEYSDDRLLRFISLQNSQATKGRILGELRTVARAAGDADQVVVYFGGHGVSRWEESFERWAYFLIPYYQVSTPHSDRWLSIEDLGYVISEMRARELVLILDCCHSGGFSGFVWSEEFQKSFCDGLRSYHFIAAASGAERAGETDRGGFLMPFFCDALRGRGVKPNRNGQISAQLAGARAADLAKELHDQTVVQTGPGGPIYLTRVKGMGKISAYRGNLHGPHGSFGSSRVMGQTGFVDFLNQLTKEFAGRDRVSETIRQILDVIKRKVN